MSAEEIMDEFTIQSTHRQFSEHKAWLRNALAAYTKHLLDGMPKKIKPEPKTGWPHSQGNTRAAGWNAHRDDCRSILQDQIDKLTK